MKRVPHCVVWIGYIVKGTRNMKGIVTTMARVSIGKSLEDIHS